MAQPRGYRKADRPIARVVVKFHDDVELPWEDGVERSIQARDLGPWADLTRSFPGITLIRNVTNVNPDEFQELVGRAVELDPDYRPPNFLNYFAVLCPARIDSEALAGAFRDWRIVERAWVELPLGGAATPGGANGELPKQSYLEAPAGSFPSFTGGINARYAWTHCGDGTGQVLISYERAMSAHEDIVFPGNPLAGVNDQTGQWSEVGHGTAVLGIVAMQDNGVGGVGIAYKLADFQWTSPYDGTTTPARRNALMAAIKHFTRPGAVAYGRVLLFEVVIPTIKDAMGRDRFQMPVEVYDDYYQTIRLATALGIVVIEPAGNRREDLDTYTDASTGQSVLVPGVRDSGALLVGACDPSTRQRWAEFSPFGMNIGTNFGSRVNCFAWGDLVWTADFDGGLGVYDNFNGTSAASAIIAGAALVVQTLAETNAGGRLSGVQMRDVLSNPLTGTPPVDEAGGVPARIGIMPDLGKIIDSYGIGSLPDVFLRDNLIDTGAAHTGPISASPDIIVLPSVGTQQDPPVPDGQVAYGEGSGLENNDAIGYTVTAGRDNFVYVRVKNRGAVGAQNTKTTVYWAPAATLVRPDTWRLVGTTGVTTVPAGGALTVPSPLRWLQANVPPPGHYCFVGLVGADGDRQPDPVNIPIWLADWDAFFHLIRDNNNITWRNFDVVQMGSPGWALSEPLPIPLFGPDPDPDPFAASFLAPGAYDRARPFTLEVCARLPEGAQLWLEAPVGLITALHALSPFVRIVGDRAFVPIGAHGCRRIGSGLFPARSLNPIRLLVNMPPEARKHGGEIAVRQLYEELEVGRVTFRVGSPKP